MIESSDLLLDFSLAAQGAPTSVRLRVFASEEEMYDAASRKSPVDAYPVSLPYELFHLGAGAKARKEKQRDSPVDPGFAQDAGRGLWNALPAPVRERINTPRDQPLRVKLCSEDRSLMELPWEWLMDGDRLLALRDDLRLVRSVPVRYVTPPALVALPLRILLVVSNPKDERLLQLSAEIDAVSQSLDPQSFATSILHPPTLAALRDELHGMRPHVVHYIGHAGVSAGDGNIILHEGDVSHWVDSSALCQILPSSVRLLCLSTCFTARNYQIAGLERLAQAPAYTSLPTAVVNRFPLCENAVRAFWSVFYRELAAGASTLVDTFHEARRATRDAVPQGFDWSSFALVVRDNLGQPFDLSATHAADSVHLAARAIRAQFKTDVLNQLAEQMKTLGADASDEVLERLQRSMDRVAQSTSSEE
jgi:CHAT domain-containing protein